MIDILIITHNEALNLPHCLSSVRDWAGHVFVVDSGSTDDTVAIAREAGAEVATHAWEGYARQRNWALRTLAFEAAWILILDADESVPEDLRKKILDVTSPAGEQDEVDGYYINRLTYFQGNPIRHCGYFPSWQLRLFRRGKGVYEQREVHEHLTVPGKVGYIREHLIHDDRRGLEHFIAKHNRYSTLEARAIWREVHEPLDTSSHVLAARTRKRRWLKAMAMRYLPAPGAWRFVYMYFVRLGFLDGRAGLYFCKLISMYDTMVAVKYRALHRNQSLDVNGVGGLAVVEGSEPEATRLDAKPVPHTARVHTQPQASPWSFREKLGRALWMLLGKPLFRLTFHNWYLPRRLILRLFGASIGRHVAIRPTVNIEVPWMLTIEEKAVIGDYAIVYSLGPVRIGARSIISQYAHLCAGTHDYQDPTFALIRAPIEIGHDVWIGTDVFIGPGVYVGNLCVVGARSSVYKDLPEGQVCVGNPARPVKNRNLLSS